MKYLYLPFVCCFLAACSSTPMQQQQLLADIQQAGLAADEVSVLMQPLFTGAKVFSHRADAAMAPASTMKILTSTAALAQLGPDWRGETRLAVTAADFSLLQQQAHTGRPVTLQHPLYLQAASDADFNDAELRALLQQLRALGVAELGGGIVLDRSQFSPERTDLNSADFDENPKARYNHQPDALYLGQQQQRLSLNATDSMLSAILSPYWPKVRLDLSAVQLVDKSCNNKDLAKLTVQLAPSNPQHAVTGTAERILKFSGEFAKNCQQTTTLGLIDRDLSLLLTLEQEWLALGGHLPSSKALTAFSPSGDTAAVPLLVNEPQTGWLRTGRSPLHTVPVAVHQSRPLAELVQRVNKSSDNVLTRLMFLTLGSSSASTPAAPDKNTTPNTQRLSTSQQAEQQIRHWLQQHNISHQPLILENGSGLSRAERVTATLLAQVLQTAWQAPYGPELLASLPLSGTDGTLKNRFTSGPAYQKARLKTGTLRDVTALAGYVWDGHNRPWVVVMLVNSDKASVAGRPLLDKLVQQLAGSR